MLRQGRANKRSRHTMDEEFTDIPISDLTVTCNLVNENGRVSFNVGMEYSEPLPLALYAIWASDSGEPVGMAAHNDTQPPRPGCFQVMIATDQRSMWGRKCPDCGGYWRAGTPGLAASTVCCYCGSRFKAYECLSDAQLAYVRATCGFYLSVLEHGQDGLYKIKTRDLLRQGIAQGMPASPPDFFVEKSKQTKFSCVPCGSLNDILGRFAYCSSCGTRNDIAMLELDIAKARDAVNKGDIHLATALKETVDGFDTVGRNIAQQLCAHVRMTPSRRTKWERMNFAQLDEIATGLKADFDIDILKGIDASDRAFTRLMFHRRHLHAHRGGIVDQKYLDDTGDTSVEVRQLVKETQAELNRLFSSVNKIAKNLLAGFHSILPVHEEPIIYRQKKLTAMNRENTA